MSANWKNPFMQKQDRGDRGDENRCCEEDGVKKSKNYSKGTVYDLVSGGHRLFFKIGLWLRFTNEVKATITTYFLI